MSKWQEINKLRDEISNIETKQSIKHTHTHKEPLK